MKKITLFLLSLLSIASTTFGQSPRTEFYVTPDPSYNYPIDFDHVTGSPSDPFKSLEDVRRYIRYIRSGGGHPAQNMDLTVILKQGTHYLSQPFTLGGPEPVPGMDSDIPQNDYSDYNITFKNDPTDAELPVVSGGINLSHHSINNHWTVSDGIWSIALDYSEYSILDANNSGYMRSLFINGNRAILAREVLEDVGIYRGNPSFEANKTFSELFTSKGKSVPVSISGMEAVIQWSWKSHRTKFTVNSSDLINFPTDFTVCQDLASSWGTGVGKLKWFENAIELLDEPGEFFYNKTTHVLSYVPLPGEVMNSTLTTIVVPTLETLVSIKGAGWYDANGYYRMAEMPLKPIKNIKFNKLKFAHTTYNAFTHISNPAATFDSVMFVVQDNYYQYNGQLNILYKLKSAFECFNAQDIEVSECIFENLGSGGIELACGSKSILISENSFTDIGSTAIDIGDTYNHTYNSGYDVQANQNIGNQYISENIELDGNTINNNGVEYPSSPGIMIAFARNCTIKKNKLWNMPYTGISLGWGWSCEFTNASGNNIIEHNEIHDVMQLLSDGAGIYTMENGDPANGPSIIRNNKIYNIESKPYVSNLYAGEIYAIYLDGGSKNITLENNWGYNVPVNPENKQSLFINLPYCPGDPKITINGMGVATQLRIWNLAVKDVDFSGTHGPSTPDPAVGSLRTGSTTGAINGYYKNNGSSQVLVNNGVIYKYSGGTYTGLRTLDFFDTDDTELSVIPSIEYSQCNQKFYVFNTRKSGGNIKVYYCVVDLLDDTVYDQVEVASFSASLGVGIAISRIKNNARHLYLCGSDRLVRYTITSSGLVPTPYIITSTTSIGSRQFNTIYDCGELDLSPDGSQIAWGSLHNGGASSQHPIFNVVRLENADDPNPLCKIYHINNFVYVNGTKMGVEFNETGNNLFMSPGNNDLTYCSDIDCPKGIFITDLSYANQWSLGAGMLGQDVSPIIGTEDYANSQIERGYDGFMYVSSGTAIGKINTRFKSLINEIELKSTINVATSSSGNFQLLPDQVDGEQHDFLSQFVPFSYDITTLTTSTINAPPSSWTHASNPFDACSTTTCRPIRVETKLELAEPGTYTITDMTFEFGKDAKLVVKNGVTLNLVNTTLKGIACGTMWDGIVLEDGAILNSKPTSGSPEALTFIYDAKTAIAAGTAWPTSSTRYNIGLDVRNTLFERNGTHVSLYNTDGGNIIQQCFFLHEVPLKNQSGNWGSKSNPDAEDIYFGSTGIDLRNNAMKTSETIDYNVFSGGVFAVVATGAPLMLKNNIIYRCLYGVSSTMLMIHNDAVISSNSFNDVHNPITITRGANAIHLDHNTIKGHVLTKNAIKISNNPSVNIHIEYNTISNFTENGISMFENSNPVLGKINIHHNVIGNTLLEPNCTGITLSELGLSSLSFKELSINNNNLENIEVGIKMYNIAGNQNKNGSLPTPSDKSDISNNTIKIQSQFSSMGPYLSQNIGILLNNSSGLSIINNTISSSNNIDFNCVGIDSKSTTKSLFHQNTITANTGIRLADNAIDNNYYCNTFNNNAYGISLINHTMRLPGDVHGIVSTASRDNSFIGTKNWGSDISLYFNIQSSFLQGIILLNRLQYNKWLFATNPLVKIYPSPNSSSGLSANHRQYINGGYAPGVCPAIYDPGGIGSMIPPPEFPNDSTGNDTLFYWQSKYEYEKQVKSEAGVSNVFMSHLIDLEYLVATGQYEDAATLFGIMVADHEYAENYMDVYEILIAARYPDIRPLTSGEISDLSEIAIQSARQAGPVVYTVRGILWAEEGLAFYDTENTNMPDLGGRIVFDVCYEALPQDIEVKLVDENNYVYSEIPVVINEDGRFYISSDYVSGLDPELNYTFQLNYDYTGVALSTLEVLLNADENTFYLCDLGKKSSRNGIDKVITNNMLSQSGIRIYPNPSNSVIQIDFPKDEKYNVEIYNLIGQKVFSQIVNSSLSISIDTQLQNGLYIIKIADGYNKTKGIEQLVIMK